MAQRSTPVGPEPSRPPARAGGRKASGRGCAPQRRSAVGRRFAVGLVAVAAAAGLAGCGGQAQEVRDAGVYATAINRVQGGFERDLQEVDAAAGRADGRADVVRAVQRLDDRVVGVQRDLRDIRPPAVAAGGHRALITAYVRWNVPIRQFRRALRDRSPRATQRARAAFGTGTMQAEQQVAAAGRTINAQLRSLYD